MFLKVHQFLWQNTENDMNVILLLIFAFIY